MNDVDILGMGCVAVDELLHVERFPTEDAKLAVLSRETRIGGTTATALLAAAALGARCAFAGTLGDDADSRLTLAALREAGIDTSLVRSQPGARPIRSQVIVSRETGSRTVLYDLAGAAPCAVGWPPAEAIRSARQLMVDQFGLEGIVPAAQMARDAGRIVVAKLEHAGERRDYWPLLSLAHYAVLPRAAATQITGATDPAAAAERLVRDSRATIVVTCGAEGLWYCSAGSSAPACHLPAFSVQARDTTGCGDTFRGAFAAGLSRGLAVADALVEGAAAAAIRTAANSPVDRFPHLQAVRQFIAARAAMP